MDGVTGFFTVVGVGLGVGAVYNRLRGRYVASHMQQQLGLLSLAIATAAAPTFVGAQDAQHPARQRNGHIVFIDPTSQEERLDPITAAYRDTMATKRGMIEYVVRGIVSGICAVEGYFGTPDPDCVYFQ